jgi:hypothetical protein
MDLLFGVTTDHPLTMPAVGMILLCFLAYVLNRRKTGSGKRPHSRVEGPGGVRRPVAGPANAPSPTVTDRIWEEPLDADESALLISTGKKSGAVS